MRYWRSGLAAILRINLSYQALPDKHHDIGGGFMWYYSFNSSPTGPVDAEALKALFRSGKVTLKTLVWQEGMDDWVKFEETTVYVAFSKEAEQAAQQFAAQRPQPQVQQQPYPQATPQSFQQPIPQQPYQQPYPQQPYQPVYPQQPGYPAPYQPPYQPPAQFTPGYPVNQAAPMPPYAQYPQAVPYYPNQPMMYAPVVPAYRTMKPGSLTGTYVTWLVFYVLGIAGAFLSFLLYRVMSYTWGMVIQYAIILTGAIFMFVFLGRCWKIVQDGRASLTPSVAIGNLFIPFYNFYWIFRAFHGLSKEINRFIDRHFGAVAWIKQHKAIPAFSLIYCIFVLVNLAYSIAYQIVLSGGLNSHYSAIHIMGTISVVVAVVGEAIAITMITDYFVAARQLLKNAQQFEGMPV
jgi:hypothetical protein